MGIAGLQGYLEKYCTLGGYVKVELASLALNYSECSGHSAVLVFDLASCLQHIYCKSDNNFIYGGQFKAYIEGFHNFIKNIEDLNIECVFFADGSPPPDRHELWKRRRIDESEKVDKVFRSLAKGDLENAKLLASNVRLSAMWFVLKSYLQAHNKKLIQTVMEADDEIMQYIADNNCLGVVGQDSDFAICEGIENYLSMQAFNFKEMTTRVYRGSVLMSRFCLERKHLPILATLCGNDIINSEKLRLFHIYLLKNERNPNRYISMDFIPRSILIPRIAEWIHMLDHYGMSVEDIIKQAAQEAQLIDQVSLFMKSVNSYKLPDQKKCDSSKEKVENVKNGEKSEEDKTWQNIVERVNFLFRERYMFSEVQSVVTRLTFYRGVSLQFYSNSKYTHSTEILRPMRQRMYGILLKERPNMLKTKVEEYAYPGPKKEWPVFVEPVYPENEDHPGLLNLWDENAGEDVIVKQWRLFCWAVSDNIQPSQVLKLPARLRVPVLSLYYMIHEAKILIETWEVEALVIMMVQMMSATSAELCAIEVNNVEAVAVHLSTVYKNTCLEIFGLAAACGYPASMHHHSEYFFYDGKLFHKIYESIKGAHEISLRDVGKVKDIVEFLYPEIVSSETDDSDN